MRRAAPLIAFLPTPVWAGVCAQARPAWSAAQGRLDAWGEAALFLTSPLGAVVILVCVLTWAVRSQALAVIALVLAVGVALFLGTALSLDPLLAAQMQDEGCLGPTWISATIYGALAMLTALRLWHLSRPL
ncbi:hypothetical protein [Oceaniglobus ichthyenteri]|uniref:hypothetical protein n=1 Tax=Oceaniglobus ichthyenteri TaxID=2136177 RepID=UPI000D354A93|nr:hypothetical protein [Oceaniglobus ichthyenteri]